jgi:exosortase A-associated hydrolase 1/exosortase A-associated hydrolase 2
VAARLLPARLDGFAQGYRWGLWGVPAPRGPQMGAVLAVQACLDEQALSRRMLAHAARGMAEAGWWMLTVDAFGTGDSAGDHGEASLERWRDDLGEAARRLRMQAPHGPLVLLGVRLGALLAVDLARLLPQPPQGLVLWNPPARGAALVDPLHRLARLGKRDGDAREGEAQGEPGSAATPMQLAGWPIAPTLLQGLRGLRLDAAMAPASPGAGIHVIQTQRLAGNGTAPPPAIAAALAAWEQTGWQARFSTLVGEPWWSAMDPCDPAPLTAHTLAALADIAAVSPRPPGTASAAAAPAASIGCAAPAPASAAPASAALFTAAPDPAPLMISGTQGPLHGVLTPSQGQALAAVLIVPGQPQTRVGAHRMFATLAAGLQARDMVSLRVDLAGWGDSAGLPGPFEAGSADIVAAAAALRARVPDAPLWLYGLCDGASALALALPALRRAGLTVHGVILLNPWVRSEATLASAMIGSYYRRRLIDPALWRRLLRGQVPIRHLLLEPLRHLTGRLTGRLARRSGSPKGDPQTPASPRSLPQALIDALESFGGEVLTLLGGADLTAAETEALLTADPRWRTRLDRQGCLLRLPGADHTLSDAATERAAIDWLAERITEQAHQRG